jgi:probable phosphoglycerate mutase
MRLFIFARHAESSANTAHVLNSDPAHLFGLTPRGREQARRLGEQLARLEIDQAVCTRFERTRRTIELALGARRTPLRVEPDLDEVRAGRLDGTPIDEYWARKGRHRRNERFPGGESLEEAAQRYAAAVRRLLDERHQITLVVSHEVALRCVLGTSAEIANAAPYLIDEHRLHEALERLEKLWLPTVQPRLGLGKAMRTCRGR